MNGNRLHAWGVLDETATSDPDSLGYVQLRNLVLSVTYTDGTTEVIQRDVDPTGAAYLPTFADDLSEDVEEVLSADGATVPVGRGSNYHFWPEVGNQPVDVGRLRSVEASFQARLAPGRPHEDPVLMQIGVDNWSDGIVGTGKPQGQIGQSRKKYVTADWSCVTFTTQPQS